MTRDDTIRILDKICRLYITQARKMGSGEKAVMLDTWEETFRPDSYDEVNNAVKAYARKGKPYMPLPADILNEMAAIAEKAPQGRSYSEVDKLFNKMANIADILANGKERQSIIDPGGFQWDTELGRKVYRHPEVLISTKSYTQYDFAQLPREIQEYVEDIEGLRNIWREIESNRYMARKRFEMALPGIKADIARERKKNKKEHAERLAKLFADMNSRHVKRM